MSWCKVSRQPGKSLPSYDVSPQLSELSHFCANQTTVHLDPHVLGYSFLALRDVWASVVLLLSEDGFAGDFGRYHSGI